MTDHPAAPLAPTGPLHAIVLAAGAGVRFGGAKLLASWSGRPLIAGAVAAACDAPVRTVTLVVGADRAVAETARSVAAGPIHIVEAPEWTEGLAASLRAGVAAVPDDAAGVFIFLGDMPRVPHAVAASLADALVPGIDAVAPVFRGRRGHPVLVARTLFPQVATLRGDAGLGAVLAGLGPRLARVGTGDDGVLFDVDVRDAPGLDA